MAEVKKNVMTYDGLKALETELEDLKVNKRKEISEKIKEATKSIRKHYTVAVMGCVVNGVGEGANADVGVAGGKDKSALFKGGKILKVIPNDRILPELTALIEEDLRG